LLRRLNIQIDNASLVEDKLSGAVPCTAIGMRQRRNERHRARGKSAQAHAAADVNCGIDGGDLNVRLTHLALRAFSRTALASKLLICSISELEKMSSTGTLAE